MADTTEQTAPAVQDPAAPVAAPPAPVAAPAAPPPAPAGAAPWAADLASLFPDEATRTAVDGFVRSKVQPYTTQLEQKVAGLSDAERLYNDITQNPLDTYVAITTEMFGEEAAQRLLTTLQENDATAPEATPPGAPDPRIEQVVQFVENEQNQRFYDGELARITADPANADVNPKLLHTFVAAAGGNFDEAVKLYRNHEADWAAAHPGTTAPPPELPPAPPVLTDEGAAAVVPTEAKNQTLGDAINDFMAEQRANKAPPVVGTT